MINIKSLLPGKLNYLSIESKITFGEKHRVKKKLFDHVAGRKFEGYPGQYESLPYTHIYFGPLHVFMYWKPFDYLSEEDYKDKYGSYNPQGETKWERRIREEKEEREKKVNGII